MDDIRHWLPGVLCNKQLEYLHTNKVIRGTQPAEFGESSLDLTLGKRGWEMPHGGLKPAQKNSYAANIEKNKDFFKPIKVQRSGQVILKQGTTYLFEIGQQLQVQDVFKHQFFGQATAKSSIGRMDVLVRLIVDGMDCYEGFDPNMISSGDMFVEITPLSFDVVVKEGIPITQLRIFYGSMKNCEIDGPELHKATLSGENTDGYLRVDLSGDPSVSDACAFKAIPSKSHKPVCLWPKSPAPAPRKYWNALKPEEEDFLSIEKGSFYILRSKEKLALHDSVAVYCLAIDESIGEMRIHYAGFVHPCFGRERTDGNTGTPLIFEVRGHDVPVVLRDGEKLAKLKYYRMSEPFKRVSKESNDGGKKPGKKDDLYKDQTLQLSKFFAPWK